MKERIKQVRKHLGLTQTAFGEALSVTRRATQQWEAGTSVPSNAVIELMERKYYVNSVWLRTGKGEMLLDGNRADEIGQIAVDMLGGRMTPAMEQIVRGIQKCTPEQLQTFLEVCEAIISAKEKGGK